MLTVCSITGAKFQNQDNKLRITFDWPKDLNQVYINGKLFTLQEYKKQGGFFAYKKFGDNIFAMSTEQDSEDVCTLIHTEKVTINCALTPKHGLGYNRMHTSFMVVLESNHPLEENVVKYNVGQYTYKIKNSIFKKQAYIIRAETEPHFFVSDPTKYELVISH